MEQEKILMGQRELKRWHLMEMVKVGKITLREAGERIVDQGHGSGSGLLSWCYPLV
jgi:hypothetical protein